MELKKITDADIELMELWLRRPHVRRWYHAPEDWLMEIRERFGAFSFLHHYIVWDGETPFGFCQYYPCSAIDEAEFRAAPDGTYSIDYLIGNPNYLRKGFGKQIIYALEALISLHSDATGIAVSPEIGNKASCTLLESCGYVMSGHGYYYKPKSVV